MKDLWKEYKQVEEERYDAIAHLYDQAIPSKVDLSKEAFVQFKLLKDFSSRKKYSQALDLACGTGRYFNFVKCKKLYGLDLSKNMLAQARKKQFNKSVVLVKGDLFELPFKNNQFDLVYSIGTLGYHALVNERLLGQVRKVLKPKGTFIFTSNIGDHLSVKQRLIFLIKDLIELIMPLCPKRAQHSLARKIGFGRYTHTQEHLLNLLRKERFAIEVFKQIMPKVWPQYFVVCTNEKN